MMRYCLIQVIIREKFQPMSELDDRQKMRHMIRFLDVILSFFGLLFGWPLLALIAMAAFIETGSPVFKQVRVGRHQKPFTLIKFRTMHIGTDNVATHLVSEGAITTIGHMLRRTRLDELLQLWNVFKGDMSLVGPRPCLFNQTELIAERERMGIFEVRPGLTGLAQIRGVDMSNPKKLVMLEFEMIQKNSLFDYFKYIFLTFFRVSC
jgi:O-antigen biosynthesis protein WbqP